MNRNDYWRKREEEQLRHNLTEEAEIQKAINDRYNYMLYQVQAQINDFYARYARREQITLAEAKQRVSKMDVQAFGSKAKKYVEEKDFSAKANQELRLYNATMRINRLELLKANIGLEMIDGFNDVEKIMDQSLTKRTVEELERQEEILRRDAGILGTSVFDNAKTAQSIVNASFNNATWSDRIWGNQAQLRNELSSLLTQGLIQGRNPRVLVPALQKMFGVSRRNAERLMVTELARVQTEAQMESFKRNDIDEYIFLSLDTACSECMALNEKHFPVKDMMPGENAPPIHPNCRCSTAAYVDREALERELFGVDRFKEDDIIKRMRLSSSKSTRQSLEAVYEGKAGLDKHRKALLKRVPNTGDYDRLPIGSVTNRDLAYLSASERHEFALWRSKTEEIICHGDPQHCNLPDEIYDELLSGKYELIAHTHVDRGPLVPSNDDMDLLKEIGQKQSVIVGIDGKENPFFCNWFDF